MFQKLAALLPDALEALAASVFTPLPSASAAADAGAATAATAGRMKQEACRVVVGRLLRAWRRADAFEEEFVDGLAASFFLFSSSSSSSAPGPTPSADGGVVGDEKDALSTSEEEFSALSDREVELLARRSGVSLRGGRGDRLRRVARAREYGARRRKGGGGGGGASGVGVGVGGGGGGRRW